MPPEIFGEEKKKVQQSGPIGFTGFGPDGKFQKNNPVSMVQAMGGPMTLHEGEATVENENGSITVIPQQKLKQMEKQYGIKGMAEGGTFTLQTDSQAAIGATAAPSTVSPQTYINQGIGTLSDIAGGKSAVTESIANRAASNLGGAQTAAIGAAKQEAAQAGYGQQAIGSIGQTAMRNMEGERSKLMGDIAQGSQQQMAGAAQNLIGVGQTERTYEKSNKDDEWQRTLTYTDPSTPEGLKQLQDAYTRLYGTAAPDFNTLKEERDYLRTTRGQSIESNALQIDAQKYGLSNQKFNDMISAINNGATLDLVNSTFGMNLTADQFNSIGTKYSQSVRLGNMTIEQQQTAITAAKQALGDAEYNSIVSKINTGATLEQINSTLSADKRLTQDQYDSMYGTTSKYFWEKNFTRDENRYNTETEYKKNWDSFQAAAQYGTAEDAAAAYKAATGKDMNPEAIRNMRAMSELQLDSQKIANDAAALQIDTSKMTSLVYMVNQGMDLATINKTLGTQIGVTEFEGIKEKYKLSVDALKTENLTASTQLQIMKGKLGTDAYNTMIGYVESGMTIEEIREIDFDGDDHPDFPNLSSSVFASIGREREISLATAEYNLAKLKSTTNLTNWNTATDMARSGMNAAQIKEATGLELTDADVQNMRTYITPEKQWAEALAYNDPTTPEGRDELAKVWNSTHPNTPKTAEDFNNAAFTTEWTNAKNEATMQAGKMVEALIGDIVDNTNEDIGAMSTAQMYDSPTVKSALANETLRQNVFTKLGLSGDKDSWQNRSRVDDYIMNQIRESYKGDVDILVEDYIQAGRIPQEYLDTPDYQGQLKRAIQDMLNSGAIDRNGNLIEGATFDWPWEDPDTRFNYVDWNGNDIAYDEAGNKPKGYDVRQIGIPGTSLTYESTFSGVKRPVTMRDMDSKWGSLTDSQKQGYIDAGGKFDLEGFMGDYFVQTDGQNGGTVSHNLSDINDYFDTNPDILDTIIQNINGTVDEAGKVSNQFVSSGYTDTVAKMIADAGTNTEALNRANALSQQENQFQYYDANGQWQHQSTVSNNMLINIWQQFSQMYGKSGVPLTSQEFSRYWADGKGWIIGEDGIVMNFKESWQKDNGVTADNPALSGEAWTSFSNSSSGSSSGGSTNTPTTYVSGSELQKILDAEKKLSSSVLIGKEIFIPSAAGSQDGKIYKKVSDGNFVFVRNQEYQS